VRLARSARTDVPVFALTSGTQATVAAMTDPGLNAAARAGYALSDQQLDPGNARPHSLAAKADYATTFASASLSHREALAP